MHLGTTLRSLGSLATVTLCLASLACGEAHPAEQTPVSSTSAPLTSTSAPASPPSAPASPPSVPVPPPGSSVPAPVGSQVVASGTLSALTYNVAGLPQGISGSSPRQNTPQISPKLNTYQLVLVQEDFFYYRCLRRDARHPFQSLPHRGYTTLAGDGLNRFSEFPFFDFSRTRWIAWNGLFSNGADGWASKGFSAARHVIAPGVEIDVYNLHADAGRSSGDQDARARQIEQLRTFMDVFSAGRAVIVAGDTNLKRKRPRDEQTLVAFLQATGLRDAARTIGNLPDEIDRFLFRGTTNLVLTPLQWRIATEFVDGAGNPLSDHDAVNVDFDWKLYR